MTLLRWAHIICISLYRYSYLFVIFELHMYIISNQLNALENKQEKKEKKTYATTREREKYQYIFGCLVFLCVCVYIRRTNVKHSCT